MAADPALPKIFITDEDDQKLRQLARPLARDGRRMASFLLSELDRAVHCAPGALPNDVVAMGRGVTYRVEGRPDLLHGILSYPDECDHDPDRVSILSPLGAALLGLRAGTVRHYRAAAGALATVTVVRVDSPPGMSAASADGSEPDDAA